MSSADTRTWIGRSVLRDEDFKLLCGAGRFLDDIRVPGLLHAVFVRSTVAHATIRSIDASAARKLAGVRAVLTFRDLKPLLARDRVPAATPQKTIRHHVDPCVLADREVCYVGEPIAIAVAESRSIAEDAAGRVLIEYDTLAAVTDPAAGLEPGAPRARLDCPDNLLAHWTVGYGNIEQAFARAAHRIPLHLRIHKGGAHSIEPRGLIAYFDRQAEQMTLWDSTQMPHRVRTMMVEALGLSDPQVRVIAPDVGGGFGAKGKLYPEEVALPAAAILLEAPIKWTEDRVESFTATNPERDQDWTVEAAIDSEGKLLAISGHLRHDHGAFTPAGVSLPENSVTNLLGPYVLPAYRIEISVCLTNMVATTATRGAGRPQGTFVMERLLDHVAKKLSLPRDEVRRRNLIPSQQMPYVTPIVTRDGLPMTYDSGDYPECQRRALEAAAWSSFPERKETALREGRWLGIGLSNYVEGTGRGPFESATVRVGSSGQVFIATGATAQGQGTHTTLAQIAAEAFGVEPSDIKVSCGDTAESPLGLGSYASRQTVTAGNAVLAASRQVADKIRQAAAALMEVATDDVVLADGFAAVKGVPELKRSFADVARALIGMPGFRLPESVTPGLSATIEYQPPALTYTNGANVVEAEVDPLTGHVKLTRYVIVHDCGNMINPALVEGQIIGGVAHGIGMTLFEWMRYDATGQPQTVTLADYLLPTSDVVPNIEIHHMNSPTPLNPLGVKGVAESGTMGAAAAIVSAIEDALLPLRISITDLPVTPARLQGLIEAAGAIDRRVDTTPDTSQIND